MNKTKIVKIVCLITVFISSYIWLFMYLFWFQRKWKVYLPFVCKYLLVLQLFTIILDIGALIVSKPNIRASSAICFIYSVLSLVFLGMAGLFYGVICVRKRYCFRE